MTTAAQLVILLFAVLGAAGATNMILPDMPDRECVQLALGAIVIGALDVVRKFHD